MSIFASQRNNDHLHQGLALHFLDHHFVQGVPTRKFLFGRGLRQVCPSSMLLFGLGIAHQRQAHHVVEALPHVIRKPNSLRPAYLWGKTSRELR